MRIERRRRAAVRQRRYSRLRKLLVLIALTGAGAGGFLVGKRLAQAPGPELTTADRGLTRITVTETVATRTITVVPGLVARPAARPVTTGRAGVTLANHGTTP